MAKKIKEKQPSSLVEPNLKEYQFISKEWPQFPSTFLKQSIANRSFKLTEPYVLW